MLSGEPSRPGRSGRREGQLPVQRRTVRACIAVLRQRGGGCLQASLDIYLHDMLLRLSTLLNSKLADVLLRGWTPQRAEG